MNIPVDSLGRPKLTFAEALNELVIFYLDRGADVETICCDCYFKADEYAAAARPERLLPDKG